MKKFLRFIGILLMGLTAAFTLLGGVGTTCVALDPTKYDSMKAIASFQWLYILYVVAGVAIGVLGVRATIQLVRAKEQAEKSALVALVLGVAVGGIHMITSRALRGSSMPVDGVVYTTVLTLIVFLLFKLPGVQAMGLFTKNAQGGSDAAGGITAFVIGCLVLSVQVWAGPTHLMEGTNYADAFHNAMLLLGGVLILSGLVLTTKIFLVRTGDPVYKFNK
jgi:hypothetical protein